MQVLLNFINQWLGGLSGVLISSTGVTLCVLVVGSFWEKRGQFKELLVVFACGVALTFNKTSVVLSQKSLTSNKKQHIGYCCHR